MQPLEQDRAKLVLIKRYATEALEAFDQANPFIGISQRVQEHEAWRNRRDALDDSCLRLRKRQWALTTVTNELREKCAENAHKIEVMAKRLDDQLALTDNALKDFL